jgi:hypothetical protein
MITACRSQHGLRKLGEAYRATLLLGIILISSSVVFAQLVTAAVSGVVTDQSGGIVVGAEARITNSDTNVTSTTTPNRSGIYLVTDLKPGRYRVHVSKEGFKGIDLTDVILNVQHSFSHNFSVQTGSVSETISVEGGAPLINTKSAAVSTVVDRNFVENMPLNGRSFNTLLQLTPEVVIARAGGQTFGLGVTPGQFSIAGQRSDANNFTVDGVSANFGVTTGARLGQSGTGTDQAFSALGGTRSLVPVEALQEFRIETSPFAPESGRAPGAQVILTTRSGTNQFHGTAFNCLRNDVFDANNWFANAAGKRHAPERQNDFGGVWGGPILQDKTFIFFSFEGLRLRRGWDMWSPAPMAGRLN